MAVIELRTTGEVAKALQIPVERLRDLLRRGKIAEPAKIGSRRAWTHDDVAAARVIVKRNS